MRGRKRVRVRDKNFTELKEVKRVTEKFWREKVRKGGKRILEGPICRVKEAG